MVVNDHYLMTDKDKRRQRIEALVECDEAVDNLATLVSKLKTIGKRTRKLAAAIEAIEVESDQPLQSEAGLLLLAQDDYEDIDFATIRALANSIAAARKEVTGALALKHSLGYRD